MEVGGGGGGGGGENKLGTAPHSSFARCKSHGFRFNRLNVLSLIQ